MSLTIRIPARSTGKDLSLAPNGAEPPQVGEEVQATSTPATSTTSTDPPEPIPEPANTNVVEAPMDADAVAAVIALEDPVAEPIPDLNVGVAGGEEPVAGEPVAGPDVVDAGGAATAVENVDAFNWEQVFPPAGELGDHPADHSTSSGSQQLSPASHAASLTMPDFIIPELEGASFWDEEVQDENDAWLFD